MVRLLLWLLGLCALAVGLVIAARQNDGFVLIQWSPWRIELSLNLFIVSLLLGVALLYSVFHFIDGLMRMPARAARYRARQRRRRAVTALRDAARLYFEGRYGHAQRSARVAVEGGESPGLAALIGARAAHAMREQTQADEWLRQAERFDELKTARLMTEADILTDRREFSEALERIDVLQSGGQRHVAALRLAMRARRGLADWSGLLRVVRLLQKHRALTPEQAAPVRRQAHLGALHDLDPAELDAYWKALPAAEREDAQVVRAMAEALVAAGQTAQARKLIESRLEQGWESSLLALYAHTDGGDALGRIAKAEAWLRDHPDDAELLLALGRLCRTQQLWGKAQSYLEAALAVQPSRVVHVELALLAEHLERPEKAQAHFRAAALMR
ncbi:MAG: heme biosynthesis protein HemY [Methyloversatilis sp.]|jgi:HemY protein|uniref:Protoheme IX synthesis protein HemY fused with protein prenyltransferase n=1 Tax=Methyloversatilis universalis (strain ATCC BAA-1314 / DSM 25237 / JCM 13912 / CCUG 52030 / FAM5) TaxID=1000565 RepID=F5RHP8_METUF|nr:heme biosynthesis HemY N-terminal domain-containing protein [Methyloversatilis universalis]EGK69880.1 Putative protoheme IX synthesis protein HemY fused with protein prenyltransferase [Methyloversatilis universalis FAM5]MCP4636567.1 heme biosynthesis protein HemY [Methyloversatilis sp.]